jgi:D-hydroxyproline dehydrogenase subunit alpha
MSKDSTTGFDVLVVGGGPAGMAAAIRAAECGMKVGIVDDNAKLGGQIWRAGVSSESHDKDAAKWHRLLGTASVTRLCGKRVFHQPEPGVLWAEGSDDLLKVEYKNLVLATGARERFLPFPGWTLPNVMGAGGLQAMVKSGLPIAGKRVVVAGTGPLLPAVAACLRQHGAVIPIVCEQAPWSALLRFAASVVKWRAKIAQTFRLKRDIAGVPFAANSWPVAAQGQDTIENVTISRGGRRETVPCDYLACGFHLVPNIELPSLLGCEIRGGYVSVDEFQQTGVPGIFCAGEPTGIGGVELSLVEGEIAGLAAAGCKSQAQGLFRKREKLRSFARALDRAFSLRSELRSLASPPTPICRCEDVSYARLAEHTSWRSAKLHTRCGMGPCQGRICGPATEFLFQWNPDSVRPPIFPSRLESLGAATTKETEQVVVTGGLG